MIVDTVSLKMSFQQIERVNSEKQKSATSLRLSCFSLKYRINVAQEEQSRDKMPQRSKVKVKTILPLSQMPKSQSWTSQKTIELVKQLVLLDLQ